MKKILRFLIPAITIPNIAVLGSEGSTLDSNYSFNTGDPGLFHYGKMQAALEKGKMFPARSHARARIPYLTLTTGPRNYQKGHTSGPRIASADKVTFELNLNQTKNESQTITLEQRLIKVGDDARIVRIPLRENFSDEIDQILKENEDRLKSIEQVD